MPWIKAGADIAARSKRDKNADRERDRVSMRRRAGMAAAMAAWAKGVDCEFTVAAL
jgi:hypothetical protein